MESDNTINHAYTLARERYAELGVDTEQALDTLKNTSVALNCWQGDDVRGFESRSNALSSGGIQATGGFPGRARTIEELRGDLQKAFSLIPGKHRLNLHAMYGDFGGRRVDRDAILPKHFQSWIDWARQQGIKLDFNATCFAHPRAESGFTLSSKDDATRDFWIEHVQRCRATSAHMGKEQGDPCIHNLWIPDGSKDITVSRAIHRSFLKDSLDRIFATTFDPHHMRDAVEGKLFGIGSESFTVGSYEFYLAYSVTRNVMLCVDMGHFHPTEVVGDKISAILPFSPELLLHVSRGVRWDSDHVVILNDDTRTLMEEIVRGGFLNRVHIALDFFDASINRVGAWVIGTRATLKSLLLALLEPRERLQGLENEGNNFARLAFLEELKTLPTGAVWDYYCTVMDVPPAEQWLDDILRYETEVLRIR
ncbi:MAG: L-rhamnose isomerase [Bacteroidetes bacterium]|nr:L-rhamnose isomerase [Bacteroidota bacterium]